VEAAAKRADEVLVARQLAARDRGELVDAEPQVARRRPQPHRRRPVAVARVAVTGAAEVGVDLAPVLERRRRDVAAAQHDLRREGRGRARRAPAAGRRAQRQDRPREPENAARAHNTHTARKKTTQTTATKSM
jgi:hypothetical protein